MSIPRAPVQASLYELSGGPDSLEDRTRLRPKDAPGVVAGTITWDEHVKAWKGYAVMFPGQSAERMAERGGFSWLELVLFLRHEPVTWERV